MIWLTILLALLLIIALILINRRSRDQSRDMEGKEVQITKLRQRVSQVEELARCWLRVSDNRAIPRELYQVALEVLDRIGAMDSGRSYAAREQQRLLPKMEELEGEAALPPCQKAMDSTGELARLQNELKEIKRILRGRTNNELLSTTQYDQLAAEIDRLGIRVALDTYLALAREAAHENQALRAEELVQQALAIIEQQDDSNPDIEPRRQAALDLQQKLPRRVAAGK